MMIQSVVVLAIIEVALLTPAGPVEVTAGQAELSASELTCEYAVDPLGVDSARPRFGWVLQSNKRGQVQSAYQILVASNETNLKNDVGNLWDSKKTNSDQSVNVVYQGVKLRSRTRCFTP